MCPEFLHKSGKNIGRINLFDKIFDIHIIYVLSPVVIQNFTLHTLFSLCSTLIVLSCAAHSFFKMSINPGMVVPFGSKNLGDLLKNTSSVVNELLTAILKAVETVSAHKFTGRKPGISCCLFPAFL
jgi:hypothetical protein